MQGTSSRRNLGEVCRHHSTPPHKCVCVYGRVHKATNETPYHWHPSIRSLHHQISACIGNAHCNLFGLEAL